ncbi:YheC/YheD family protein [Paenibacillus sp. FA6]|uniref:YheC/YheD family protein n=1 Tax=Paenibacillus sp. FA6 TaxID=3413029 RepID=UPI003F65836D
MAGRQLASKWLKTEALLSNPSVIKFIPLTRHLTIPNLRMMLRRFGMVVVKPVVGGGGYGVIRIIRSAEGYKLTHQSQTLSFASFKNMIMTFRKIKAPRPYLIQQGIRLATINGRPIDYRVKVVKSGNKWIFRSMVGRLAKPGLFVTNLCKGGRLLSCHEGLRRSIPKKSSRAKRQEMRQLTRVCTTIMERHFPGIGELGFDYGVDMNGRIWIFEVNTRPQ